MKKPVFLCAANMLFSDYFYVLKA